jgi:hypothetical protein
VVEAVHHVKVVVLVKGQARRAVKLQSLSPCLLHSLQTGPVYRAKNYPPDILNASPLRRATTVVGNGREVFDADDGKSGRLKGSDGGFSATAWALDKHAYFP